MAALTTDIIKQRFLKQKMALKKSNLPRKILDSLKDKKKFENHILLETDKNQGSAIMEKTAHNLWILEYLNNEKLYTKIDDNQIKIIISKIKEYYNRWPKYNKWFDTSNEKFGRFFGLLKVHKKGFPIDKPALRPIISIKGTILEKLSGYLHKRLWPMAKKTYSFIKDSRDLSNTIKKVNTNRYTKIYTLDITDLYNNINLETLITVIQYYIHKRKDKNCLMKNF